MVRKVLWIVDGDMHRLVEAAKYVGASAVCIRTTNHWLKSSIKQIKKEKLDVFAWRWPAVEDEANSSHHYAMDEAKYVVDLINDEGLDGYIVDPEGDSGRSSDYWNDKKWAPLATKFSNMIADAGKAKKPEFLFGTTSGCTYPTGFPHIPWTEFVGRSDALFPQAYWVGDSGPEHGGTPQSSYAKAMKSWSRIASGKPIIPIIGQIAKVKSSEIRDYAELIHDHDIKEIHFYSFTLKVPKDSMDAMRDL